MFPSIPVSERQTEAYRARDVPGPNRPPQPVLDLGTPRTCFSLSVTPSPPADVGSTHGAPDSARVLDTPVVLVLNLMGDSILTGTRLEAVSDPRARGDQRALPCADIWDWGFPDGETAGEGSLKEDVSGWETSLCTDRGARHIFVLHELVATF